MEAHLGACASCSRFLDELRASQAQVKGLAAEEIDSEALAVMRVRTIVGAARSRRSRGPRWVPAWAAAAAVILALGTLVWVVARVSPFEPVRTVAVAPPPPSALPATLPPVIPPPVIASPPSVRSTLPGPPAVSPHMERAHVRRRADRPSVVPALSPDDADQLARAVVAIARVERVDEAPFDAEPPSAPLMRLATADPDVVIYWQLEPNGGN